MINRERNRITFNGSFVLGDLHRPLAMLHKATHEAGYQEIILDFSECLAAFPPSMLALCVQVMKLREQQIDFNLILPSDPKLNRLFRNTNWANILAPHRYSQSEFKGYTQVPATIFTTAKEQAAAVNRIVDAILGAIPDIERRDFAALEWSINEITDNVLVHSQSPMGGIVQVSTFTAKNKRVEYIVADAGIGIPASLRETHPEITSDVDALDRAIREGVTRDASVGQGNGLFGSYQICSHSNGFFEVASGWATLAFTESDGLHVRKEQVPFDGTLIIATIDFSVPHLLEESLKFGGVAYSPCDYVELHYENSDTTNITFRMKDETQSFGSRIAGIPVRTKLLNLSRMCNGQKIIIDFSDVPLISSSFADEAIGKLFTGLGPLGFMKSFELRGVTTTVQQLIDRAITQRLTVRF